MWEVRLGPPQHPFALLLRLTQHQPEAASHDEQAAEGSAAAGSAAGEALRAVGGVGQAAAGTLASAVAVGGSNGGSEYGSELVFSLEDTVTAGSAEDG